MRSLLSILARPIQRWHWAAAEDDRRSERWESMVGHLEALHRLYFESDESHFLLGSGYAQMGRDEDAIQELAKIKKPLSDPGCEGQRKFTLATCHYRLGRWRSVIEVVSDVDSQDWPTDCYRREATRLLESATVIADFEKDSWPLVQQAIQDQDWDKALEQLRPLHTRGLGTCTTLIVEAEAYAARNDWAKVLAVLDGLGDVPASAGTSVQARFGWLRALAFLKLGYIAEYNELISTLEGVSDPPPDIYRELYGTADEH